MMTDIDSEDDDLVLEGMMDDLDGLLDTTGDDDDIEDVDDLDSSLAEVMAEASALLDSEEEAVEKTIQTMEATQLCVHPDHSHSFSKVTFTLGASLRKCAGCQQPFKSTVSTVFGTSDADSAEPADPSIVKCVACGAMAHRSCALSSTVTWDEPCPINGQRAPPPAAAPPPPPVVTDEEEENYEPLEENEEAIEFEVDLETKLSSDDINPKARKSNRRRTSSFTSNSDESMATQELEDEEGVDEILGTDETDPAAENGKENTTSNHGESSSNAHSPNGTAARRAISNLLFPNKQKGTDNNNPYADQEEAHQDNSQETAQSDNNAVAAAAAAQDTTTNSRKWFQNSPMAARATRGGKRTEEGGRTWFSSSPGSKQSDNTKDDNNKTEESTPTKDQNDVNTEPPPANETPPSSSSGGVPWLSSSGGAVQEDYGDDVTEISNTSNHAEGEDATKTTTAEEANSNENTGGRRWFQKRRPAENEEEGTPTASPMRLRTLFSKKRTASTDDNTNIATPTDEPVPATSDAPHEAVVEFSNFLDVETGEDNSEEIIEYVPVGEAEFSEFLDVDVDDDDDDDDNKEQTNNEVEEKENDQGNNNNNPAADKDDNTNSATEKVPPQSEEKRARVGFGLFRRKKNAASNSEEDTSEQNSEVVGALQENPEEQEPAEPEGVADTKAEDSAAGEEGEKAPEATIAATTNTSRFRLFARKGNDKSEAVETSQETVDDSIKEEAEVMEETADGDQKDSETGTGEENRAEPEAPSSTTTSRFRLFARRGNDPVKPQQEASDGDVVDDVTEEQPQVAQNNTRASYIGSLWRKTSVNDDHKETAADDAEVSGDSNPDEECEQPNSEADTAPAKPSLLSRVFSPAKSTNTDDDNEQTEEQGPKTDEANLEEPTTRRFLRFSARKVADSSTDECGAQTQGGPADESLKAAPRKFSLFGFGRAGTDPASDANNANEAIDVSWASDEPPSHWATATTATFQKSNEVSEDGDGGEDDEEGETKSSPLHYANHPFASVSRALEDNILALHNGESAGEKSTSEEDGEESSEDNASLHRKPKPSLSLIVSPDLPEPSDDNDAAIGEIRPAPAQDSTLMKVATDTYEVASATYQAVTATATAQKKLGVASVAGGIAGGVAGLMFAGPAGAVMGVRYGRTAGALGVILEGSLTVGVIVAGVAGGRFTAEKIQEQIEDHRVLTIGETGVARKVMLVRPTIRIDPVWNDISAEAQRTAPSSSFTLFSDGLKKDRYEKTSDIIEEDEIPTDEKVLLIVSRVLSDKDSFPGHVYRSLMQAFTDRCEQRKELMVELAKNKEDYPHLFDGPSSDSADTEDSVNMGDGVKLSLSPRARREDAHGVIKYITGTLLEVRPGLASTPQITETTASVVEALVFGQVYDLVYEEIAIEATERDKKLLEKIDDFEFSSQERTGKPLQTEGVVSKEAVSALRQLPETHSAADKLRHCVVFLEKLSDHFANVSSKSAMGADSLLKMVCQHIIAAKMSYINAEVAFLEEFARDEQLLRGKEGYALVTLQASLHFLNMSNDFERDIFGQDNDEENVPLVDPNGEHDDEENTDKESEADENLEHMSTSSQSADEKSITEAEDREEKKEEPEQVVEEDLI
ncbi:expressed unknown protein [Seminavis robusta]|uniref:VPS9 domain-containing protein n=1 Tax=Seminavis robusta TaxID=568900 RepID=A0A9N8EHQ9_9STRA|nr:expressed unknown protein [Seminavis robusta]|eukprot:Sro969_g226270.1 n/a (1612) ;mRNA; r:32229-37064